MLRLQREYIKHKRLKDFSFWQSLANAPDNPCSKQLAAPAVNAAEQSYLIISDLREEAKT